MIALLQRVSSAKVEIEHTLAGEIAAGLLVFLGIERNDKECTADKLLERLLQYRLFNDDNGRMNLSLRQTGGGLLLVSQFTLAADTRSGLRPSFSPAADPTHAKQLYDYMLTSARASHQPVASGKFAANMQVSLINDGPVTFWLQQASQ